MQLCLARYPFLASLAARPLSFHEVPGGLEPFRRYAVDIARETAVTELHALHDELPDLPPDEARRRRGRIHQLLQRISPGRCSSRRPFVTIGVVCSAVGRWT